MKCVENIAKKEIRKVSDSDAEAMVDSKSWAYCSRGKWKKAVGNIKEESKRSDEKVTTAAAVAAVVPHIKKEVKKGKTKAKA